MKERHWNGLVATLRHGQCVLVVGPEIAARRGPGAGDCILADELARALAQELEDDDRRPSGSTLPALAQQYEDTEGFGPNALRASAERFYQHGGYGPSPVHEVIAALPFPLVLTTCHDALLSQAMRAAGKSPLVQRYHLRGDRRENPEFLLPGSPASPVVYHLFGVAAEPASLVLTENDVLDFLIGIVSENPPMPNSLLRVLKRPGQSFVFVGFGIRHWQLRILLKVILRVLDVGRGGNTIAAEPLRALATSDREDTILFYQRGTRVEVEDCDVGTFLQTLAARLQAGGGYVGDATAATRRARVFISYAREDEALASRVQLALQQASMEPWLDRAALVGGEDWDLHIESELQTTDFALVLYTPAFCRKTDSYVNREVALARRRAMHVRGSFLVPLRTEALADEDRVRELAEYQEMELRSEHFEEDMAKVISTLTREIQRRNR